VEEEIFWVEMESEQGLGTKQEGSMFVTFLQPFAAITSRRVMVPMRLLS
jgi:hypothetical protein